MEETTLANGCGKTSRNIVLQIKDKAYVLNLDEAKAMQSELGRMIVNIEKTQSKSRSLVVRPPNAPAA